MRAGERGGLATVVIRPSPSGLAGSACLLAADVAWLVTQRPPGLQLVVPWFLLLLAVGAFLPGVANQVTLSRAHLAAPALVYSLLPERLVELVAVVGLAGLSDVVDGTLARRLGQRSRLGGGMDPVVDGLCFGALAVGLAVGGVYPPWLAGVVLVRYGLPALGGVLLLAGRRRPALEHTPLGQASTAVIVVLLAAVALSRGLGWPGRTDGLPVVAEVLIPPLTLLAFANLVWANRRAIWRSRPSE